MKWTDSQLKAIEKRSGETVVSASAGSGKTSVMIERLVRLISEGVGVDEVLCLTFTKAAAEGMREKLKTELKNALTRPEYEKDRKRLEDELDKLPFATITTIDAFCAQIVKKYFERSEIPVDAELARPDETKALRYLTAVKVLEYFGEEGGERYSELVGFLGKKRSDGNVLEFILSFYEFLSSYPDEEEYLRFSDLECKKDYQDNLLLRYTKFKAQTMLRDIETKANISCLKHVFPEYASEVGAWAKCLREQLEKGYTEFSKVASEPFCKKINKNRKDYKILSDEEKRVLSDLEKSVDGYWYHFKSFSIDEIRADLALLSPYITKLVEIVARFCVEYKKELRKRNLTDFSEIEHECLKCLRHADTAERVRKSYPYLLVDEFQDTNRLQDEILSLSGGEKSSFMVGDVKQSIYAFRHAEPDIFLEHANKIPEDDLVRLKENFRQAEEIVEFVNGVFTAVMKEDNAGIDYEKEKMIAGLPIPRRDKTPITICYVDKSEKEEKEELDEVYSVKEGREDEDKESTAEGAFVYREIKKLVGREEFFDAKIKPNGAKRMIRYDDIVILYRGKSDRVSAVKKYLREKGVPIAERVEETLSGGAQFLIQLLRVIKDKANDGALAILLLSPMFDFCENELAQCARGRKREESLYDVLYKNKEKNAKLVDFFAKIEDYTKRAEYSSVYDLFSYVIADTDFDKKLAEEESGVGARKTLSAYVDSLLDNKIASSTIGYLNHFDSYPEFKTSYERGGGNAVRFMTMHHAKGLEFPVVFCIDMTKKFNTEDLKKPVLRHKKYGLTMQGFDVLTRTSRDHILRNMMKERLEDELAIEEMRLLYVALTRARNFLYISGKTPTKSEEDKDENQLRNMMAFINHALNQDFSLSLSARVEHVADENDEDEGLFDSSEEVNAVPFLDYEYPYLKSTKTPTKYTVTNLVQDEYEEGGVSSFVESGESAEEGTLYHKIMGKIDFSCKSVEEELEKMVLDEVIRPEKKDGIDQEIIKKTLSLPVFDLARANKCRREQSFLLRVKNCDLIQDGSEDEVLLQGTVDLIIENGDECIVVDYKYSGASEEGLKKRYTRQLELYQKAVQMITGKRVKTYLVSLKTARMIELD